MRSEQSAGRDGSGRVRTRLTAAAASIGCRGNAALLAPEVEGCSSCCPGGRGPRSSSPCASDENPPAPAAARSSVTYPAPETRDDRAKAAGTGSGPGPLGGSSCDTVSSAGSLGKSWGARAEKTPARRSERGAAAREEHARSLRHRARGARGGRRIQWRRVHTGGVLRGPPGRMQIRRDIE